MVTLITFASIVYFIERVITIFAMVALIIFFLAVNVQAVAEFRKGK